MMNSKTLAYFFSIFLHLVLAIAAYFYYVPISEPKTEEVVEVVQFGLPHQANNQNFLEPAASSLEGERLTKGEAGNVIPKRVELPEAITSAEEQVYVPKSEELVASTKIQDKVGNVNRHIESNIAVKSKNRQIAEKPELGDQSDFLNSISEKLSGGERESPFILEGDIIHRTILHKVIPEYPDNVQKNAQIKIKFNVSAEGDVTDVILIKKADPILDQISVEAIQKWRFNSIEQDVQQTGFITFRYKIK